jgi:hypothetical protein
MIEIKKNFRYLKIFHRSRTLVFLYKNIALLYTINATQKWR